MAWDCLQAQGLATHPRHGSSEALFVLHEVAVGVRQQLWSLRPALLATGELEVGPKASAERESGHVAAAGGFDDLTEFLRFVCTQVIAAMAETSLSSANGSGGSNAYYDGDAADGTTYRRKQMVSEEFVVNNAVCVAQRVHLAAAAFDAYAEALFWKQDNPIDGGGGGGYGEYGGADARVLVDDLLSQLLFPLLEHLVRP